MDINGEKHYLFDTRDILNQDENIFKAEASIVDGNKPTAFIQLKMGVNDVALKTLEATMKRCRKLLSPLAVPVGYRFVESFAPNPYTHKIDLEILKTIKDGFYNIDENGLYVVTISPSGIVRKDYTKHQNIKRFKVYKPVFREF
jgi:hypothetical protein